MISRRIFLFGTMAPIVLGALPVRAQDSCGAENEVVTLADYVLANRSKLPKLQSRRVGAISAYLKIRYQNLASAEQIDGIIGPLVTARADRARELLIAWRISTLGLEEMLSQATPEAETDLLTNTSGLSMLRAAVISGELPYLFGKMAAIPEERRGGVELALVKSMVDIDDTSALEIANEASKSGLTLTAAGIVATHGDQAAWREFAATLGDKAKDLTNRLAWMPALRGQPALPRDPIDAQGEIGRSLSHQAMIAAAHTPERDFLLTYLIMMSCVSSPRRWVMHRKDKMLCAQTS